MQNIAIIAIYFFSGSQQSVNKADQNTASPSFTEFP